MPLTVPALHNVDRIEKARGQLQDAKRKADEASRRYADARQRVERLSMRLASAQADEMLDEPGEDPTAIRADLDTARKVEDEAGERARETVMMLDALQARAPDVWEQVHDRYREKAFSEFADVLDNAADALEQCLESIDAVTDAQRGNQWLNVAADSLALPGWLTRDRRHGSSALKWIDKARKRAERLRNRPQGLGTGYSRTLRQMREDAEQDD